MKYPVGYVKDNIYYTIRNNRTIHKSIEGNSFGVSEEVLLQLLELGIEKIIIKYRYKEEKFLYKTNIEELKSKGFIILNETDKQYHLLLDLFEKIEG